MSTGLAILATSGGSGWTALGHALSNLSPAWIAVIGTVAGGVILKVTEKYLGRNREKKDDAKQIREELRLTVSDQKADLKELEDEVNEWRSKYYDLRDSYVKIQTELTLALNNIKTEAVNAEKKLPNQ